ncbi:MAG: hypothetical protein D3918_14275 [Candidatus Electrothrix sp. AX2]|nr:hypothetical protein [Candidatus Electrothrix gigas]
MDKITFEFQCTGCKSSVVAATAVRDKITFNNNMIGFVNHFQKTATVGVTAVFSFSLYPVVAIDDQLAAVHVQQSAGMKKIAWDKAKERFLSEGRRSGLEEGIEKGALAQQRKTVLQAHQMGINPVEISALVGLSEAEVQDIISGLEK